MTTTTQIVVPPTKLATPLATWRMLARMLLAQAVAVVAYALLAGRAVAVAIPMLWAPSAPVVVAARKEPDKAPVAIRVDVVGLLAGLMPQAAAAGVVKHRQANRPGRSLYATTLAQT